MPIEDVFTITGRGTVVTGRVENCLLYTSSVHFKRLPYLMSPAKPMKAIDMSPAVMSVIGSPRRQRGIPALVSIRSRIPAMRTIASRKPAERCIRDRSSAHPVRGNARETPDWCCFLSR